ncbi:motility protein B [Gottschalkia purinilytica]|uniref:Motility protein B n=1 Tax=Gottschalkia purinilytica TaxID=1503 RepID=A0A0L0WBK4_GOTPU|nr:flagellar motor protein MotB [Gottschalkia purinilytica]KNF08822.1 motility protein B [Gottschalkia purinilytica]
MRRKRNQEEKKNTSEWIVTYSDLVTLLLCFFVLLFSFSSIDAQKFKAIMNSFQGSTGVMPGGKSMEDTSFINKGGMTDEEVKEMENLAKLEGIVKDYSEEKGFDNKLTAKIDERGLVIRMLDNMFFDSGKAEIKPETIEVLNFVGEILRKEEFKENHIKIEGHTDSDAIVKNKNYPTNWELSATRATNVLRYLVENEQIDGNRISSAGYSYYRPVTTNDSPENKAKNRRVDLVILKSMYSETEPKAN